MDRSLAGRSPFWRPRAAASGGSRAPRAGRAGALAERGLGLADSVRGLLTSAWAKPRARIAMLCVLAAIPVLGGGFLLLRHSRFVAVEHVRIAGVEGPQAAEIAATLRSAAVGMSTLDVDTGALKAAVAHFHVVSALHAKASFPHSLSIEVVEQQAVAALVVGGQRTAVAANGTVLGADLLTPSLPTIAGSLEPLPGEHLHNPVLLEALRVLGAAPAPLTRYISRAYIAGQRGLTVQMTSGLLAYFGDSGRPHAKWDSLIRVLADPSSAGASYVDVRVPEHPAAGFPDGVPPTQATAVADAEARSAPQSAIATLAETLSAGAGVSTTSQPTGVEPSDEAKSGEATSGTSTGSEAPARSSGSTESETSGTTGG
jgi:cell division protein FtsQ